jgi:DNA-binding HxlR family transcriptional regulator
MEGAPRGPYDAETMHDVDDDGPICKHFARAAELIGRRWNVLILRCLQRGAVRYKDLKDDLPDISDAMLSERLKELEGAGIVTRDVTPSTPVRIAYGLTERGRDLTRVMDRLGVWAERWADEPVGG